MNTNLIMFGGNLTKDPIARGGGSVAAFSVACNRSYQKNGEWHTETTYADVSAFGHNASKVIEKLSKGDPILVTGRLELNSYTDSEGEKHSGLRIVAAQVQSPLFTAKLRRAYRAVQSESAEELPTSANVPAQAEEAELAAVAASDDDIPF